ncbi:MAG: TonB-dependent receptor, partial [Bacteroidota bacterium]
MRYIFLVTFLMGLLCGGAYTIVDAQHLNGTLRGNVSHRQTLQGLGSAALTLKGPVEKKLTADAEGNFSISALPVGLYVIEATLEGYQPFELAGIRVRSAKEAIVQIQLEPQIFDLDEVTLVPDRPRGSPNNNMTAVSVLSFDVNETQKFAGGLDDPTRLAANFPGVVATPFISENFISIRGNSSRGLLYRLEGVDLPNPNHFARIGASGGSFTIFSNQLLANSDFFVGAFPAEYGNATAGVFDIQFRNGNQRKREFAFQAGVLGLEAAAEGPFKVGGKASFLVNYRYATLNLVNRVIDYLSIPTYQDLSFKLHLPTEKAGTFDVFGMGGISNRLRTAELDSSLWERDLDRFENDFGSDMMAVGISHTLLLGEATVWKSTLLGAFSNQYDNKQYLEENLEFRTRETNTYQQLPLNFASSIKHQFSPRHLHKSGIIYSRVYHDFFSQDYDYVKGEEVELANATGWTNRVQAYSQSRFSLNQRLTLHAGLHALYFDLNQATSLEPRAGLEIKLDPRQSISLGYGLHSQIEHWATYSTQFSENGTISRPNEDLGLLKAHHFVGGYQALLNDHLRLRAELYYQNLTDVPVSTEGTYSVLNVDELDQLRTLNNDGTAQNYGLDVGLERFSRFGLYYMLNASVYSSTYTDATGTRHSTAFDNGYKVNLLMGKEYPVGKKKGNNSLLGLNTTISL